MVATDVAAKAVTEFPHSLHEKGPQVAGGRRSPELAAVALSHVKFLIGQLNAKP
jgi:hypothetical protein